MHVNQPKKDKNRVTGKIKLTRRMPIAGCGQSTRHSDKRRQARGNERVQVRKEME
jgi:hypothetical protein